MSKSAVLALLAVLSLAGCGTPIAIKTQPAPVSACMDALMIGTLVTSNLSGFAVRGGDEGDITEVEWPFEYTAKRDITGLALYDSVGVLVAHEGDVIQMGGGSGADGVFHACPGSISVVGPKK